MVKSTFLYDLTVCQKTRGLTSMKTLNWTLCGSLWIMFGRFLEMLEEHLSKVSRSN